MRPTLACLLLASLFMLGCDIYESVMVSAPQSAGGVIHGMEDGTGFPPPHP